MWNPCVGRSGGRLAAAALAFTVLTLVARSGTAAFARSTQSALPISATLFTSEIEWRTAPRTIVTAELRDGGLVVGRASAVSSSDGRVVLRLRQLDRNGPHTLLTPGRSMVLTAKDTEPLIVWIPELSVDADADTDRVLGTAPAGASVDVHVEVAVTGETVDRRAAAGDDGSFALDLGDEADLQPGDGGHAHYVDADGHTFRALFHVLTADILLDANRIALHGTPGTELGITTILEDGTRVGGDRALLIAPGTRDATARVTAGDRVAFEQVGGPLGGSRWITVTVPGLSIQADPHLDAVSGTGPPRTTLDVEGKGPGGETVQRAVTTTEDGTFDLPLAPDVDVRAGWRFHLSLSVGPGVRCRRLAVTDQARLAVHTPTVAGWATPGQMVTVTLLADDGSPLFERTTVTSATGEFWLVLEDFDPDTGHPVEHRLVPGRGVEVAFTAGDPVLLRVPAITARTDPVSDVVSGEAPPGSVIAFESASHEPPIDRTLAVDASGTYRVDLAGTWDLKPPDGGTVAVVDDLGHESYVAWTAVGLTVAPSSRTEGVTGNAPFGRAVTITLEAPDGTIVGSATDGADFYGPDMVGSWHTSITDSLGHLVAALPGDVLRAQVGDDEIRYTVDPLDAVLHVEDDVVSGSTAPDVPVEIVLSAGLPGVDATALVVSDPQGIFSHDFSETVDIIYNNEVVVDADLGRHTLRRRIGGPGLTLDLSEPSVRGSIEPLVEATVELRGPAGTRLRVPVRSDLDAVFSADFETASGEPIVPEAGDVVIVSAPRAVHYKELRLDVPALQVRADADSDEVSGTAPPDSQLTLHVWESFAHERLPDSGWVVADLAADGAYATAVTSDRSGTMDLRPGHMVEAYDRLASGHRVLAADAVPMANVQHGGANVCGVGRPLDPVEAAALDDDGGVVMSASAHVDPDRWYEMVLRDPTGRRRFVDAGTTVRARIGGDTIDVDLPDMHAEVDWNARVVRGHGPRQTGVLVFTGASDCIGSAYPDWVGRTDGNGDFESGRLIDSERLHRLQVAFFTPDDHRYYRQIFRSLVRVHVHRDRVAGRSMPLTPVTVTVLGLDGSERAAGAAETNTDGHFDLRVADARGRAIEIEPGDTVVLGTTGETPRVLVEELDFDVSVAGGIEGVAPVGREVRLTLTLSNGDTESVTRQTDDRGRFVLAPEMLPPRLPWSFEDVVAVEAVLETPAGHEMVAEAALGSTPWQPLYVPLAHR